MKTVLKVDGIHCSGCKGLIEDICGDFSEITSANLNESTKELELEHADGFDVQKVIDEIQGEGDYSLHRQ